MTYSSKSLYHTYVNIVNMCVYIYYIYIFYYIYIYSIFILLILLVYPGIVELSSYFLWGWIRGFSSPVAHLPLSGFPESQPTGKVVQNTQVLNHYYCLNKWCTDLEVTTSFTDPLVVFNRNLTVLYIKWIPQITQELWQSNGGCWGDCKCLRGEDSRFFAGNLPLFHSKVIEGGPLTLLNLTRQREWWLNVTNKQQTCRQVVHIYTYKQNMGASYIYIYIHTLYGQGVSNTKSPLSCTQWLLIFTELFGLQNSSIQALSQSWALRWARHASPGDVSDPENALMWSKGYIYIYTVY